MGLKNYLKKSAFTLAEVVIALFIIGILAMITLPVINRQLDKTDEYAYYMAFKTVEKMASQVVTLGEPYSDDVSLIPEEAQFPKYGWRDALAFKFKMFFNDISTKMAYTERNIRRKLFPKSIAAQTTEVDTETSDLFDSDSFISDIWLGYRVCTTPANTVPLKSVITKDPEGKEVPGFIYYTNAYFNNCYGYNKFLASGSSYTDSDGNKIMGPIEENGVLQRILPSVDAFNPSYIVGSGDNATINYTSLLSAIKYNSVEPNSGHDLCTAIGNSLKNNYQEDVGRKVTYSTAWAPLDEEDVGGAGGGDDDDDEDPGYDIDDSYINYVGKVPEKDQGICRLTKMTVTTYDSVETSTTKVVLPQYDDSECSNGKNGYYNMYNVGKPDTIECEPKSGYFYSDNNPKYACPVSGSNNGKKRCYAYSNGSTYSHLFCEGDFNETTKKCCPAGAIASGNECKCASGYELKGDKCVIYKCPEGYSEKKVDGEDVCVLNPPIIKAKSFCEAVAKAWNIKNNYCSDVPYSSITGLSGSKYYSAVFNAALGNNTNEKTGKRLMSIDSKPGSFEYNPKTGLGLKPNLILSNGLYLWIMGDRVSSIPGLTYTTDDALPDRNVCRNLNKETKSACKAADKDAYFCASENGCYKLSSESINTMGDARNCCNAPDLSDIAASKSAGANSEDAYFLDPRVYAISGFTVFVDINGARGNGTLWEDVFPFYIGANGMVYPGYPLDGYKVYDSNDANPPSNINLGGNSTLQLPTDVYYYDITSSGKRVKKVVLPNVSYARALCSVRKISKNSPYCLNLGEKFHQKVKFKKNNVQDTVVTLKGTEYLRNDSTTGTVTSNNPCDYEACYISVRRKLRAF